MSVGVVPLHHFECMARGGFRREIPNVKAMYRATSFDHLRPKDGEATEFVPERHRKGNSLDRYAQCNYVHCAAAKTFRSQVNGYVKNVNRRRRQSLSPDVASSHVDRSGAA